MEFPAHIIGKHLDVKMSHWLVELHLLTQLDAKSRFVDNRPYWNPS